MKRLTKMTTKTIKNLNKLLPLVAIGTIADCQSILDKTNRLLVKTGLTILEQNQHQIPGLSELMKQTGLDDKIKNRYALSSQDLAFTLSPILNSSGRISHARESIELLLENRVEEIQKLAIDLVAKNQTRKQMIKDIYGDIHQEILNQLAQKKSVVWLEGPWHKGLIGLIASKVVNEFELPVVVVSTLNDSEDQEIKDYKVHASLRSPENFSLTRTLKKINSELFLKFGGHKNAAGFSSTFLNLPKIYTQFLEFAQPEEFIISQNLKSAIELPKDIESWHTQRNLILVSASEIDTSFLNQIFELDPFGQDFPFPLLGFELDNIKYKFFGNNKHLKLFLSQTVINIFNVDKFFEQPEIIIQPTLKIWIQAKPVQNAWNGKSSVELIAEKLWIKTDS